MESKNIFSVTERSLRAFIKKSSMEDIKNVLDENDFEIGKDFYKSAAITEFEFINKNKIIAQVEDESNFEVIIENERNEIFACCECEEEDSVCKHTIAVLIHAFHEKLKNEAGLDPEQQKQIFLKYVNSLTKDELKDLVLKFAPENYKNAIIMNESGKKLEI